jgi:hypothetical protein
LSDWLALLQRHGNGRFLHAFAREPRPPEDDVSAFGGRGMPPDSQPVRRGPVTAGDGFFWIKAIWRSIKHHPPQSFGSSPSRCTELDMDTLYVELYNDI